MDNSAQYDTYSAFQTNLGWIAVVGCRTTLKRLSFGHPTEEEAIASLDPFFLRTGRRGDWNKPLVRRLQSYAAGVKECFDDVLIDLGPITEFRRKVIARCRQIPFGQTMTYGELAAAAGFPRAARAVGHSMAANRVPLVVPCHRVVGSDGALRGFSAAGGLTMKRRLLEMESG